MNTMATSRNGAIFYGTNNVWPSTQSQFAQQQQQAGGNNNNGYTVQNTSQSTTAAPAAAASRNADGMLRHWKSEAIEHYRKGITIRALPYNLFNIFFICLALHVLLPCFQVFFRGGPFTAALQSPITFFLEGDSITRVIVVSGIVFFTVLHAWLWCTLSARNMTSRAPLRPNRLQAIRAAISNCITNLPLLCFGMALYGIAGIFLFGLWMQPTTVHANPAAFLVGHSILECQLVPLFRGTTGENSSSSFVKSIFMWLAGSRTNTLIDDDEALQLMAHSCNSAFSKAIVCSGILAAFVPLYAFWYFYRSRNYVYCCTASSSLYPTLPLLSYNRQRRNAVIVAAPGLRHKPMQHYILQAKAVISDHLARQCIHVWYIPRLREVVSICLVLMLLCAMQLVSIISNTSYHNFIHMVDAYIALRIIIMGLWRMQVVVNDSFMSTCVQPVHFAGGSNLNWIELLREHGTISNIMSLSPEHGYLILDLLLNDAGDTLYFEQGGLSIDPAHAPEVEEILLFAMSQCDTLNAFLEELNRCYESQGVESEEVSRLYAPMYSVGYWSDLYAGALLANAFVYTHICLAALKVLRVFANKCVSSQKSYIVGGQYLSQIGKLLALLQRNASRNSFLFMQFDREVAAIYDNAANEQSLGEEQPANSILDIVMSSIGIGGSQHRRHHALTSLVDNLLQQRKMMFTALETALAQL